MGIKASMNLGLSDQLKIAFPNVPYIDRPLVQNKKIQDPGASSWLAGFTSGEGCFMVRVINSSSYSLRVQVQLVFKLTQHSRDEQLIRSLVDYLGCGNIYVNGTVVDFKITKFSDLTNKIISFFQKYSIIGVKVLYFADFMKVAELMSDNKHLTIEGLV